MNIPVPDAIAAAQAVGVRRMVTVGDTMESSRWCAATAGAFTDVYAAVAVHPNEVNAFNETDADELASMAALPDVRAVGETGLDYYWGRVDPLVQQAAFRTHIEIAKAAGKALVIHDRDAHGDVLRILLEVGAPDRTVFHCFSGDASMATQCAARGYYMSFAGTVTFKNAAALREAAAVAPLELILVETDAPFLASERRASLRPLALDRRAGAAHVPHTFTFRRARDAHVPHTFTFSTPFALHL
jgi:TatD DNase family protein